MGILPNFFYSTLVFVLLGLHGFATTFFCDTTKTKIILLDTKKIRFKEITTLPKIIKEASGLQMTRSRFLWTHNDDGVPALYCIDTTGSIIKAVHLNVQNNGWEDLTQDESENLYIGAFGNNKNDRRNLRIYKITNPENINEKVTTPEIIEYRYADQKNFPPPVTQQNFDADAFFALDTSLFIISKNRTEPFSGYSKIYQLSQQPGKQTAQLIDSIFVGKGSMLNYWITGADISPDKKTLAFLFHDRIWLLKEFHGRKFSEAKVYEVPLNHFSHKAGICFYTNEKLFIVDELEFWSTRW